MTSCDIVWLYYSTLYLLMWHHVTCDCYKCAMYLLMWHGSSCDMHASCGIMSSFPFLQWSVRPMCELQAKVHIQASNTVSSFSVLSWFDFFSFLPTHLAMFCSCYFLFFSLTCVCTHSCSARAQSLAVNPSRHGPQYELSISTLVKTTYEWVAWVRACNSDRSP